MDRELISRNSDELVGQLKERWNVGKATVYQRLKHLGFAIRKIDGESFLYSSELSILDELDDWIKAGNSLATFPKPGALVQSEQGEIDQATIELDAVEDGYQLRQLIRTGQEKAAGLLIAQNMIAAQFKDNPDALDPDLREQVKASEEAIAPKSINPLHYASSLVNRFTQSQKVAA